MRNFKLNIGYLIGCLLLIAIGVHSIAIGELNFPLFETLTKKMPVVFFACVTALAIPKFCGARAGGIVALYIIAVDDIQTLTLPSGGTGKNIIVADIVPKSGKFFVKWEFDENQASTLKSTKADNSDAWEITQTVTIPDNQAAFLENVSNMVGGDYLILSKDGKGRVRVGAFFIGTEIKGMTLAMVEDSTGENFSAKPGTVVNFKRSANHAAYFYTGAIATA